MKMQWIVLLIAAALLAACQPGAAQPERQATEAPVTLEVTQPPAPTATALPPEPTVEPTATLAPTAKPTPLPPTPAIAPENLAADIQELAGTWKGRWSDVTSVNMQIRETGDYKVFFPDGQVISTGRFAFEDGMMNFLNSSGEVSDPCRQPATYQVYVTRAGDHTAFLRFVLVGEDQCVDRVDYMDGKTLQWVEP
jgi:hypothetical protein